MREYKSDGDWTYYETANDCCTISSYRGHDKNIIVPKKLGNDLIVTAIGHKAFGYRTIESLTIQEGVKKLLNRALCGCTAKEINLPDSLRNIGLYALYCKYVEKISLPDNVKSIDECSLYGCESLKELYIGKSVKVKKNFPLNLSYSNSLEKITVHPDNKTMLSENSVLYDKNKTCIYKYPSGSSVPEFTIPYGITNINRGCFSNTKNLKKVILPDSVKQIEQEAFYNSSISEIKLNNGIETIGPHAFNSCKLNTVVLPDSVSSIGRGVFSWCNNLTSVKWSANCKTINPYMFEGCKSLSGITGLENITNIEYSAFSNTMALTSIRLPHGLISIGANAFYNSGLYNIIIPKNISVIGGSAFASCQNLSTCTIDPSSPDANIITNAFAHNDSLTLKINENHKLFKQMQAAGYKCIPLKSKIMATLESAFVEDTREELDLE